MTNVVITNSGVNEIISAGGASSSGPYFPIKYFLLVYDPSFDESIHSVNLGLSTDALPFSANSLSADTNAVQHSGHLIFNIANAYDITDTQFLISGSGIGKTQGYKDVNTISGNAYNHLADINTIYGLPLVSCFSGDGITTSGTGNVGEWYLANAASYLKTANISGSSTSPFLSDKSKYFNVSSYSPIGVPSSDQLRGLFKCRVDNSVGNFVFNKVALFTTSYDESGNESSSNPVLVAMAALNSAVRKTNDGGNIANVEIDVECQFNVNNTTTNISYMSQDYWTRANNATISGGTDTVGLYYNGDVVIGTSGTNWQPSAHLEVTDNVKQQLRLNNVFGDQFVDFNVQSDASMKLSTSGTDQILATFFKKDSRVYIGEEIKIVDYEGGALYNENFADFIGQQIFLSGGDYSGTTEAPTTSKGQYIYLTDKVNTTAIGQDIFALRTLNYADNFYGSKIVLSADTDIDASVNSYGLYVSLGDGMSVVDTGFSGKLFAAYFDKGAVQFNDNVYFDGISYLRDQMIISGTGSMTFTAGTGVLSTLPLLGTDLTDTTELRFNDTNCFIKRNSNVLTVQNSVSGIDISTAVGTTQILMREDFFDNSILLSAPQAIRLSTGSSLTVPNRKTLSILTNVLLSGDTNIVQATDFLYDNSCVVNVVSGSIPYSDYDWHQMFGGTFSSYSLIYKSPNCNVTILTTNDIPRFQLDDSSYYEVDFTARATGDGGTANFWIDMGSTDSAFLPDTQRQRLYTAPASTYSNISEKFIIQTSGKTFAIYFKKLHSPDFNIYGICIKIRKLGLTAGF